MIVLDRNLRVVTREGADDLRRLDPKDAREYWINLLIGKLEYWKKGDVEDESD